MDSYRPSPASRGGSHRGDSYGRRHRDARDARDTRDSPREPPPMYHFGTDSYRPSPRDSRFSDNRNRENFTFQSGIEAPRFQASRPTEPSASRSARPPRNGNRRGGAYRGRGPRFPFMASERPILRSDKAPTPERLLGMSDGRNTFLNPDDLSDSDANMDLESDDEGSQDQNGTVTAAAEEKEEDEEDEEPSHKKARPDTDAKPNGDSAPKWSNPDPYTALPPPDESQAKKKDVVQLIRKAKVSKEQEAAQPNAVTENADFISLNFDDPADESSEEISSSEISSSEDDSKVEESRDGRDQRSNGSTFSHLDALHPNRRTQKEVVDLTNDDDARSNTGRTPPNGTRSAVPVQPRAMDSAPIPQRPVFDYDLPPSEQKDSRKRKREELDGSIRSEWEPRSRRDATPWYNPRHGYSEHVSRWLHNEIIDFYEFVRPREYEEAIRHDLIQRLNRTLSKLYPGSEVKPFGSFAAGLYLPTADMDLVLISSTFRTTGRKVYGQDRSFMYKLKALLQRERIAAPGPEIIFGAKVPIIKFVDQVTGLRVDMSFENLTGVVANTTFHEWKQQHPAMPILVTIVKQFLLMRGLNEVFSGGLGGFTVTCLVTSLLQNMPAIQSGNLNPRQHLGQMLIEFFDYYGNKFNMLHTRIHMDPPKYVPKGIRWFNGKMEKADRLSIIDPNKPDNDISQGSHKATLVFKCFAQAFKQLQEVTASLHTARTSARSEVSILGCILGGDYSSFERQRDRLWRLYHRSRN